jgi:hypothetical protein
MPLTIEIDFELADKITIENLKEVYQGTLFEIKNLKAIKKERGLEDYQKIDYAHSKQYRKHIGKVLRYFMTQEEAKKFFNE